MYPTFPTLEMKFPSLSREGNLREQITDTVRAAVISGRMQPGMIYSAPLLAEMLEVSPTPVREAMLDLVNEHLVETVRNKGFRVTKVSDRELDEMTATRLLLEVPTMGAIADAYDSSMDNEFKQLRRLAGDLESAADNKDLVNYVLLDTEFHSRFLTLHGNHEIVTVVQKLRSRNRLYGLEALARTGKLAESTQEHIQMVDLAIRGDRSSLELLTRAHLNHTRSIWASSWDTYLAMENDMIT